MSGAANCPETPRQKMIGMMYLVLTAMLALNVSADILNGFILVNDSLKSTLATSEIRNEAMYESFADQAKLNPQKIGPWLDTAKIVKEKSDELYLFIEDVKDRIIKAADGSNAIKDSLQKVDNLDAAGQVGLPAPNQGQGKILQEKLEEYSLYLQARVEKDPVLRNQIENTFKAEDKTINGSKVQWVNRVFEGVPAIATLTILSKMQSDIRHSEAEVVGYLRGRTDAGDYRVNSIDAIVIPTSKYVMRGGKYSAQIALSATDSTKKPKVMINGKEIENGLYEFPVGSTGSFTYSGEIILPQADGTTKTYAFNSDYIVGEPSVTISADMMNVFYAGIGNTVSISVPGVPSSNVKASMSGGDLTRTASGWVAKPAKVGQECVISVSAEIDGKTQSIGSKTFRVKALPPPVAILEYRGDGDVLTKFKGSEKPFPKKFLLQPPRVKAELDDADLDVRYNVINFELSTTTSTGITIVEASNGANWSPAQEKLIKEAPRGKKMLLRVRAIGPDGIARTLPLLEINVG